MKTLAISFGIGAFLGSNFISATSTANKQVQTLNTLIRNLEKNSEKVEGLKKLRKEIINTSREIAEKKNAIDKLKKSLKEEGTDTEATRLKIKSFGEEISKLQKKYGEQKQKLKANQEYLKKEGVEVDNLSQSYKKLQEQIKRAEKARKINNFRNKITEKSEAISSGASKVATGAAATTALIYPAIKKAIQSESAYADVKKQFDFAIEEEAKAYRENLEKIISEKGIAISLEELYSSAATAGQSGIDKNESLEYIELATKMGVAFDISRQQAAETMFQWKNAFNKPLPELKDLIDQVNYLGNSTGASSPAIAEFVNRVGNIGTSAGFATGEIASIGATLIEQGMAPEIAATGAKKLMSAMTKGFAATGNQKEVYEMLGLDPEYLAKEAQQDAQGTMLKILKKIKGVSKDKQGAILTMLFGEEGMRGAAGLLQNIDRLQRNFSLTENKNSYLGSSDKEFEARQATLENQILILKEMAAINVRNFGELLLPTISSATERLVVFSRFLIKFQKEHPKLFDFLAKSLLGLAAGLTVVGTVGKVVGIAGKGIAALMTPTGLAVAIILSLVAAGYMLYKNWDIVKEKASELREKVSELVNKYWYMLGPIGYLIKAGKSIYENWDTIKLKAIELKEKIVDMVMNGINNFVEFKDKAVAILRIPFDYIGKKVEDLKNAGKELKDYFLEIFEEIKNFSITGAIKSGASYLWEKGKGFIPGFATGGIVNSPTLAMIGEGAYSEAVIPLNNDSNSLNLWEKTGRLIGAYESKGSQIPYSNEFKFTYAPVVNASNADGVREVLEKDARIKYEEFKSYFERYQQEMFRRGRNGR